MLNRAHKRVKEVFRVKEKIPDQLHHPRDLTFALVEVMIDIHILVLLLKLLLEHVLAGLL